jgi:hypothetical protein
VIIDKRSFLKRTRQNVSSSNFPTTIGSPRTRVFFFSRHFFSQSTDRESAVPFPVTTTTYASLQSVCHLLFVSWSCNPLWALPKG